MTACSLLPRAEAPSPSARTWMLKSRESFESGRLPEAPLRPNELKEADPFSDDGAYFHGINPKFKTPKSYRGAVDFGQDGWLRLERYSRSKKPSSAQYGIVTDPENAANHALEIRSPDHTDGVVIRSSHPLPPEYRLCVKGGYADFGSGKPGSNNGYRGSEAADPWIAAPSLAENGLYWLTILDDEPRPRNNVWIHHHRKAVIDSDNNWYPETGSWSRIFNGSGFVQSGEHPVMLFVLDAGKQKPIKESDRTGRPFISWSQNRWNSEVETGEIRAVDAYLENTWYDVCIQKTKTEYTLSMTGKFRYGGETTYTGTIDRDRAWEREGSPDYFMFGDPHVNYYRGRALFDDIRLYVPEPEAIYVSTLGNDNSGDGSAKRPFATLAKAAEVAGPGREVLVHGGTYAKTRTTITVTGEKEHPIVFKVAPGEHVILDGGGLPPSVSERENKGDIPSVVDIRHSKHVVFEGFEVAHSAGYGISVWESEDITVRDCEIHDTESRGLGGTGAHLVFEGNTIHDVVLQNENEKVLADAAKGKTSYWSSAAATWYREDGSPTTDVLWKRNTIYRAWGEGLNVLHVDGAIVSGNTVRDSYSVLIYIDHSRNVTVDGNFLVNTTSRFTRSDTKDLAGGVLMASEHYNKAVPMMLENVVISNNIMANVSVGVGFWRDPANQDPSNRYHDIAIAHNVIDPAGTLAIKMAPIHEPSPETSENFIVNNVFLGGGIVAGNPELWTVAGNLFAEGQKGLEGFRKLAKTRDGDAMLEDPRPTSPRGAEAYRPRAHSPLFHSGVPFANVKVDFLGKPRAEADPTPGAFE